MGVASVALLALGLAARWSSLVPTGLVLLGATYALSFGGRGGTVDGGAVLVAPALLLVAELAFWSLETTAITAERGLAARRLAVLGLLLAASTLAATLLLGTTAVDVPGRSALVAAGVAAAAAALALTAGLARR